MGPSSRRIQGHELHPKNVRATLLTSWKLLARRDGSAGDLRADIKASSAEIIAFLRHGVPSIESKWAPVKGSELLLEFRGRKRSEAL